MDLSVYRHMPRLATKKKKEGSVGFIEQVVFRILAVNTEKVARCDVFGLSTGDNSAISLK
jgi:hypothetical protein